MSRLKDAEKKLAAAEQAQIMARASQIVDGAARAGEVLLASADLGTVGNADALRTLALDVRSRLGESEPAVVAVAGVANERPLVVVATNQAARDKGVKAGDLVRLAAKTLGGGGGGKPDLAQGGGQDATAVPAALHAVAGELGA